MIKKVSYISKNGVGDMVVLSVETYERQQAIINLYAEGENFFEVARYNCRKLWGVFCYNN